MSETTAVVECNWCNELNHHRTAVCTEPPGHSGRHSWANPNAHPYIAANRQRPEDGCRWCGYLAQGHAEAADMPSLADAAIAVVCGADGGAE